MILIESSRILGGSGRRGVELSCSGGGKKPILARLSTGRLYSRGNVSETESDTSSVMGDLSQSGLAPGDPAGLLLKPPSPASAEQLSKRMASLLQENRVLKVELTELLRLTWGGSIDSC